MVILRLELTEQSDRMWIIGQPAEVAIRDAAQLLVRVVLLCACSTCA